MQVPVEAVGVLRAEVVINPSDGQIHLGQLPGGRVGFLAVDAYIAQLRPP